MAKALKLIVTTCILALAVSLPAWATSPPQGNKSYRGDVNGDFVVTLTEVVAVRDLTSLKPVDCSAVIPASECNQM